MPICKECDKKFPSTKIIDGKRRSLTSRRYCLECSPFYTRSKCGPKPRLGVKMKGNYVEVNCKKCNKQYKTKYAEHTCSACKAKAQRNKKKKHIYGLLGGKCKICGYNKWAALDVHHLRDKHFDFSAHWSSRLDVLIEESKKCILLCRNCHAELHAVLAL